MLSPRPHNRSRQDWDSSMFLITHSLVPPYKILWGKSVDSVKEGGGGIRLIQGMKTHQQLASCREAWISAGPPFHKAAVSTRGVPSLLCLLLSPSVPCFDSFVPKQPHAGLRTQGTPSFCWPSLAYSLQSWVGACGPGLQTPPCSVPCFFLICCPRLRTQVGGGCYSLPVPVRTLHEPFPMGP